MCVWIERRKKGRKKDKIGQAQSSTKMQSIGTQKKGISKCDVAFPFFTI